jgi:HD-like signal output (HDOD) protein
MGNVPTLPDAATRALVIAQDPNCSVRDFSKVIENDPALAASLLKLVNSSYYAGTGKINNLTVAITRLGLRETQNLILAVSVRSVFRWMRKEHQTQRERLWRHSCLTAVLSRQINEKLGLDFKGEEFAAGIAHDIGRIMIAFGFPDEFSKLCALDQTDENRLLEEEVRVLGFTHSQLGAWLATSWNLPTELSESIEFHHEPQAAPDHRNLTAVVNIAEAMANYIEASQSVQGIDLSDNAGWRVLCNQWESVEQLDADLFATAVMADAMPEAEALTVVAI